MLVPRSPVLKLESIKARLRSTKANCGVPMPRLVSPTLKLECWSIKVRLGLETRVSCPTSMDLGLASIELGARVKILCPTLIDLGTSAGDSRNFRPNLNGHERSKHWHRGFRPSLDGLGHRQCGLGYGHGVLGFNLNIH